MCNLNCAYNENIENELKKLFDMYNIIKSPGKYFSFQGEPFNVSLPGICKIVPTLCYISLVSILDKAIEAYIRNLYHKRIGEEPNNKLKTRIEFLNEKGHFKDKEKWETIRKNRNAYAHELNTFSNWQDFEDCFRDAVNELTQLGIIKASF
jgi:hypothetical protein